MKEKTNGKMIFVIIVIIILALQAPVRNSVWNFFTKHDVLEQLGIKKKTQDKIKNQTDKTVNDLKDSNQKLMDDLNK